MDLSELGRPQSNLQPDFPAAGDRAFVVRNKAGRGTSAATGPEGSVAGHREVLVGQVAADKRELHALGLRAERQAAIKQEPARATSDRA